MLPVYFHCAASPGGNEMESMKPNAFFALGTVVMDFAMMADHPLF